MQAMGHVGPKTCVVLAGDHRQMRKNLRSPFAVRAGDEAHSLFFRLYIHAQKTSGHRVLLRENFRSRPEIVSFISQAFYGLREYEMDARAAVPLFRPFPALTFLHAEEQDLLHRVSEIVQRIVSANPTLAQRDIAVISSEQAQVKEIRNSLRSVFLQDVTVDNIYNVQGKEFQVIADSIR